MVYLALSRTLGVGVFVAIAPAAAAAGDWLFLGLMLAAATAMCCGVASSVQAEEPACRGARHLIPARMCASTFLIGRVAALAAIGVSAGERIAPEYAHLAASAVILLVVLASTAGVRVTPSSARWWLGLTAVLLAVVVSTSFAISPPTNPPTGLAGGDTAEGVTGAAGMLFFAFLGFEGVSTSGETRARKTRHRAIAVTTVLVGVTGAALLYQLGPARLALSPVPELDALTAAGADNLRPVLAAGAAIAMFPLLLACVDTMRSAALVMGSIGELPGWLIQAGARGTPVRFDLAAALAAVGLSWLLEPASAIGLAACCTLVHYALVNANARVLATDGTRAQQATCVGMCLTVVLAMSMPVSAMLGTMAAVVAGPLVVGALTRRWR